MNKIYFIISIFSVSLTVLFCHPKDTPFPKTNGNLEYFIKGTEVNFREGPGKNHKIIRRFTEGERIYPIEMETGNTYFMNSTGWLKVTTQNKESGWVSSEFVSAKFLGIKSGIFMSTDEKESDGKYRLSMLVGIADHKLVYDLKKLSAYVQKNINAEYFAYDMGGKLTGEFRNPIIEKSARLELSQIRMDRKYSLEKTFEPKIGSDLYGQTGSKGKTASAVKLSLNSPEVQKLLKQFENIPGIFSCRKETVRCEFYKISLFIKNYIYYSIAGERVSNTPYSRTYHGLTALEDKDLDRLKSQVSKEIFSQSIHEIKVGHFTALTDLDEDGVYELWTSIIGYEWGWINMHLLDERFIIRVMDCFHSESGRFCH